LPSKNRAEATELIKGEVPDHPNSDREPGSAAGTEDLALDRLSHAFETSAKRWELIVYPSMFAFIILASYGFYLVFSLAKDVHYLAMSHQGLG